MYMLEICLFRANKMFTREQNHSIIDSEGKATLIMGLNIYDYGFLKRKRTLKICTHKLWWLVSVNVHLLASGDITKERHGGAGRQGKDLYRAVATAETDIGRHGLHDKSLWTGGTRLRKQEKHTLNWNTGERG